MMAVIEGKSIILAPSMEDLFSSDTVARPPSPLSVPAGYAGRPHSTDEGFGLPHYLTYAKQIWLVGYDLTSLGKAS